MRILSFDELSEAQDRSRALVSMAAFGNVFDRERVETYRRRLKCFSEYVAVFAVNRDDVLGQVFVLRLPFEFPDGSGQISAIASVGTRPDVGRTGVAETLLREVHHREREAGLRVAALWTNRSWGAHHLYEKIGYRDVYSPPWVVRLPSSRRPPKPPIRFATPADLDGIERLHRQLARERLGHRERPAGWLRVDAQLGYVDPATDLLVRREGRELVGYAHLDRTGRRIICGELLATSTEVTRELIAGVAWAAHPLPWAFQHTLVTDNPLMLREPASVHGRLGWYVMMGCDLSRDWTVREAEERFGTRDSRFICLAGDRF